MKFLYAILLLLIVLPSAMAQDDLLQRLKALNKKLESPPVTAPAVCQTDCKCKSAGKCTCTKFGRMFCDCPKCTCTKKEQPKVVDRPRFQTWDDAALTPAASNTPLVIFSGIAPREVKGAIACINNSWPTGVYVAVSNRNNTFSRWKGFTEKSTDEELLAVTKVVVQPTPMVNPFRPWEFAPQRQMFQSFRGSGGCST